MSLAEMLHRIEALLSTPLFKLSGAPLTPGGILLTIFSLLLVWWLAGWAERGLRSMVQRRVNESNQATLYAVSRMLRYAVLVIGLIVVMDAAGINLSALAVFGGAVGVGIGLGLQGLFNNLVSGLILLLEKTLKMGDFIDLESGISGTVREIGLRYTHIATNDHVDVIVPNSELVSHRVTNWTYSDSMRRLHVPFRVAYGSDKALVREAALAAARSVEFTVENAQYLPDLWLVKFGDNSLDFELIVWIGPGAVNRPEVVIAKYVWAIEDELAIRNLEIPLPQRDLHLRSGILPVQVVGDADKTGDEAC